MPHNLVPADIRTKDRHIRVLVKCPECGKSRYVQKQNRDRPGYSGRCMPCTSNHPLWESRIKSDDNPKR